jgi:hypothetical protein
VDGDVIELDDLPPAVSGDYGMALGPSLRRNDSLRAWGSRYARLVLDRYAGNKREACRTLGITYHTLQSYLRFPIHDPPNGEEEDGSIAVADSWRGEVDAIDGLEVESAR